MKFNRFLFSLVPEGGFKEMMRSLYYKLYYNRKRSRENGFYVYYKKGIFEYRFKNGVSFLSCIKVEDELKLSLPGYLKEHEIKDGQIVIDCGAEAGEFTLYAAKKVGASGRVIVFEPDPSMIGKLKLNIELNALHNVTIVNKGVWSRNTLLKFSGPEKKFIEAKDGPGSSMPVVSLDEELKALGVEKVDFIKMDVEGSEVEAVKGAVHILKDLNPDLAIASYHEVGGERAYIKLENMLRAMGYEVQTAHPQHITTYASKRGKL